MREIHVSQITDYKVCPRMYMFRYVDRLVPIVKSNKLSLGTGIHVGLAAYYTTKSPATALEYFDVWAETEGVDAENLEEITGLGPSMLEAYFEYSRKNDTFQVLSVEQSFRVPIWTPSGHTARAYHRGTFDGVVRDVWGKLWLMEHKTASQFPSETELRLDEQTGFYLLAATQLYEEQPVGVIYNVIRKVDPKKARSDVVKRIPVLRNSYELDRLRERLYYSYKRIMQDKWFIPSPGKHCAWRCAYQPLCVAMEDGSDYKLMEELAYKREEELHSYGDRLETLSRLVRQRKEEHVCQA